jgi:hypothetical protein
MVPLRSDGPISSSGPLRPGARSPSSEGERNRQRRHRVDQKGDFRPGSLDKPPRQGGPKSLPAASAANVNDVGACNGCRNEIALPMKSRCTFTPPSPEDDPCLPQN